MITGNQWRKNVRLCNQKLIICCANFIEKYYSMLNLHGNKIFYIICTMIKCKMIIISRFHYQIVLALKTTVFKSTKKILKKLFQQSNVHNCLISKYIYKKNIVS